MNWLKNVIIFKTTMHAKVESCATESKVRERSLSRSKAIHSNIKAENI